MYEEISYELNHEKKRIEVTGNSEVYGKIIKSFEGSRKNGKKPNTWFIPINKLPSFEIFFETLKQKDVQQIPKESKPPSDGEGNSDYEEEENIMVEIKNEKENSEDDDDSVTNQSDLDKSTVITTIAIVKPSTSRLEVKPSTSRSEVKPSTSRSESTTDRPSSRLESTTDRPSSKLESTTDRPSSKLESTRPSSRLESITDRPSSRLESTRPSSRQERTSVRPSSKISNSPSSRKHLFHKDSPEYTTKYSEDKINYYKSIGKKHIEPIEDDSTDEESSESSDDDYPKPPPKRNTKKENIKDLEKQIRDIQVQKRKH